MQVKQRYLFCMSICLWLIDNAHGIISINGFPTEEQFRNTIAGFVVGGLVAFYAVGVTTLAGTLSFATDQAMQDLETQAFIEATGRLPDGSPAPTPGPPAAPGARNPGLALPPRRPARNDDISSLHGIFPYPYNTEDNSLSDSSYQSSYLHYSVNRQGEPRTEISKLEATRGTGKTMEDAKIPKAPNGRPRSLPTSSLFDATSLFRMFLKMDVNSCLLRMTCEMIQSAAMGKHSFDEHLYLNLVKYDLDVLPSVDADELSEARKIGESGIISCEHRYPDCPQTKMLSYFWSMGLSLGRLLKNVNSIQLL